MLVLARDGQLTSMYNNCLLNLQLYSDKGGTPHITLFCHAKDEFYQKLGQ